MFTVRVRQATENVFDFIHNERYAVTEEISLFLYVSNKSDFSIDNKSFTVLSNAHTVYTRGAHFDLNIFFI